MTKYYDKRSSKIINTDNEIPEWLLEKKTFLLPVDEININIADTETYNREPGIYVFDDKVEVIRVRKYHVNTLDEEKTFKVRSLKKYAYSQLPDMQDQLFVLAGIITGTVADNIKQKVLQVKIDFENKLSEINSLNNIEEVVAFDIKRVDN